MSIPFKNLRPSAGFLPGVFKRHQHLSLKRRCNLEHDRSLAMSVQNMAEHFARLTQVYEEYGITSGAQVFNLDESGFSTRTAHRARAKAVCEKQGRSNAREMKCSKNADHVTIMPIVSADGRIYDPVAILPGKRSKWRMRPDGNRETPACFLPENARVAYRDPAGMDTQIFNAFADWFVSATVELRSRHRNIVLTLDGYGAHKSFQALELLKRNNIFVIALPAHTSHRTQVLDYSIFSPFKTYLRNALNERVLTTSGSVRNDIYTLCELVHDAYKRAWTYNNIVSGFLACGLWCPRRKRPLPEVIKLADITNIGEHPSRDAAFKAFAQLTESFKRSRNLLRSDGPVAENGTLNTKAGALLTSQDILDYLESRAKSRAIAAAEKVAREVAALQRRSERETEADERARARRDAEDARLFHVTWMSLRDSRARGLLNSRGQRRVIARQRALRTKGITPQI